jgi:hypothetical protein
MNNRNVASNQGTHSHSSTLQAQAASGSASRWQRQGRRQFTTLFGGLFVLLVCTGALLLTGCSDDDDDTFVDITGARTKNFVSVMPVVNDKDVVFQGGVMGAVGPATLSVRNFNTCSQANCQGEFPLTGGDDISAEGDSDGVASCFFLFEDSNIQAIGTQIQCLTCDLEVVGQCVVSTANTPCQVRWLLSDVADVAPEAAAVSDPFGVTFTLDNNNNVVAIIEGQSVVFDIQ